MELYAKFIVTMAFGLLGLGIVLQVLLEQVFCDWDVMADIKKGFKDLMHGRVISFGRTEDVLGDLQAERSRELTTRLVDMKRKELREMDLVEHRLETAVPARAAYTSTATATPPPVKKATTGSFRNPVYDEDWG